MSGTLTIFLQYFGRVDNIMHTVAAQIFTHLFVVSSRQRLYGRLRCEGKGRDSTMKLYHKIFKSRDDMSVYLENMDPLISYDEELLNRLTNARSTDVGNWGQTPLG